MVVCDAAQRAGLGRIYAHRLRHTAATAMLQAGSPLAEVGQVLRHRSALTTAIYAKVDRDALVVLAAATLTKFLPAVVLPAFCPLRDWRLPIAFVVTLVVLYLPYSLIGWQVFGFLPGYSRGRICQRPRHLSAATSWHGHDAACLGIESLYRAGAGSARFAGGTLRLCGRAAGRVRGTRVAAGASGVILGTILLVALSPHYPWYLCGLRRSPVLHRCRVCCGYWPSRRSLRTARSSISRFPPRCSCLPRSSSQSISAACRRHVERSGTHSDRGQRSAPSLRGRADLSDRVYSTAAVLDQPLKPAVRDLPAHLRIAQAASGHELEAVRFDRRSGTGPRARGAARCRRADAGEGVAARIRHLKGRGMCALFNTNAHCCRRRNIGRCSIAGWMNCASCSTWRT